MRCDAGGDMLGSKAPYRDSNRTLPDAHFDETLDGAPEAFEEVEERSQVESINEGGPLSPSAKPGTESDTTELEALFTLERDRSENLEEL